MSSEIFFLSQTWPGQNCIFLMLSLSSCSHRALYMLHLAGFVSEVEGNYGWIISHSVIRNFIVTQQPWRPRSPQICITYFTM